MGFRGIIVHLTKWEMLNEERVHILIASQCDTLDCININFQSILDAYYPEYWRFRSRRPQQYDIVGLFQRQGKAFKRIAQFKVSQVGDEPDGNLSHTTKLSQFNSIIFTWWQQKILNASALVYCSVCYSASMCAFTVSSPFVSCWSKCTTKSIWHFSLLIATTRKRLYIFCCWIESGANHRMKTKPNALSETDPNQVNEFASTNILQYRTIMSLCDAFLYYLSMTWHRHWKVLTVRVINARPFIYILLDALL